MTIYTLHIDSRIYHVRATSAQLREAMYTYTRAERAKGIPLADIIFCWTPLYITNLKSALSCSIPSA